MVILLDIDPGQVISKEEYQKRAGVPVILSHSEADILAATHIIVPPVQDLKKSIRFLHLHNIFNMLRIIDKPVLGVGTGLKLMCEFADDSSSQACLGLFKETPHYAPGHEMMQNLKILNNDTLTEGVDFTEPVKSFGFTVPVSDFTLVVFEPTGDTAILRNNNYTGLAFDPLQAGTAGTQLLSNFVRI